MAYPFQRDRIYVLQALTPDNMITVIVTEYLGENDTRTHGIIKFAPGQRMDAEIIDNYENSGTKGLLDDILTAIRTGSEYIGEWLESSWKVRS